MSDSGTAPEQGTSTGDTPPTPARTMPWWYVVVPAATFVIGLVIGALVTGVGSSSDDEASPAETESAGPTPADSPTTASADTTVVVPRECIEAAETAEEATQLILDNLSAVRNFEGERIIELLDRLEELSQQTQDLGQSCSEIDVDASDVPSATP